MTAKIHKLHILNKIQITKYEYTRMYVHTQEWANWYFFKT